MAEQQVRAIDRQFDLRNTCSEVLSVMESGDFGFDTSQLAEQLLAVKHCDLPGVDRLWPTVKHRLSEASCYAYAVELQRAEYVEAVFPADSKRVYGQRVGVDIMTASQFRRRMGLGAEASRIYGELRTGAVAQLRNALAAHEPTAKPVIPTKADVRAAAATVMGEITERIKQAAVLVEQDPKARSVAGRITGFIGNVVQWKYEEGLEGGIETNAQLRSLTQELRRLVDDPAGYLSEEMTGILRIKAETLGRQQAADALPGLVSPLVNELQSKLLARLKGTAVVGQTVQMTPTEKVRRPRKLRCSRNAVGRTAVTNVAASRTVEELKTDEGFHLVGEVPVTMPWLGEGDAMRTLKRYDDGQGNTVLCIEAQSSEALDVEAANRQKHGERRAIETQDLQWRRVLRRLAAAGDFGVRQFPSLRSTHSAATAEYMGVAVQYDKQIGGSQKVRTYFTHARAKSYIDRPALDSLGIDPQEPVVILLGRCDKFSEDAMIRLFRTYSRTAALRKAVAL